MEIFSCALLLITTLPHILEFDKAASRPKPFPCWNNNQRAREFFGNILMLGIVDAQESLNGNCGDSESRECTYTPLLGIHIDKCVASSLEVRALGDSKEEIISLQICWY